MGKTADEEASRAAGQAAGYCWAPYRGGRARCTKRPGHRGPHVDHYTGRQSPTDMQGVEWD
ncbi:hypothetical protein ACFY2G_04250 [Streptomyces collinus]|uniref:hypothetical protein n=1 Tax=Streptomyces collinus TaxID=42684 RepID=UPI0036960047